MVERIRFYNFIGFNFLLLQIFWYLQTKLFSLKSIPGQNPQVSFLLKTYRRLMNITHFFITTFVHTF